MKQGAGVIGGFLVCRQLYFFAEGDGYFAPVCGNMVQLAVSQPELDDAV